jgi:2-oxo-4-hydroxy-4-carboxy-5-ureidoimidazoline decarboxylase
MRIEDINGLDRRGFSDALGRIFEDSPWVAERAFDLGPFASVAALHAAMQAVVERAASAEQLALLRAHPDLGRRAKMSEASAGEQEEAGLDRLTPDEHARLQRMNTAYRERFGFPFLFAVKGSTKHDILEALERRLEAAPEDEFRMALEQVYRIAGFRLEEAIR